MQKYSKPNFYVEKLNVTHAKIVFNDLQSDKLYEFTDEKKYTTIGDLESRYQMLVEGLKPGRDEKWYNWIMFDAESKSAVGTLQATFLPGKRLSHVAYVIWPRYWSQGYASGGLSWLLSFIEQEGSIEKALAYVDVRNIRSQRVTIRNGFLPEDVVKTEAAYDIIYAKEIRPSNR